MTHLFLFILIYYVGPTNSSSPWSFLHLIGTNMLLCLCVFLQFCYCACAQEVTRHAVTCRSRTFAILAAVTVGRGSRESAHRPILLVVQAQEVEPEDGATGRARHSAGHLG